MCSYELYKRVASFLVTRCFGWGLPTTMIIPIADGVNHSAQSYNTVDMMNKRLHLMQNKIYGYQFNFDADSSTKDSADGQYDKSSSKFKLNVKRVFKEDHI